MSRCGDMAIRNYPRWRPAAILDLMQPEIAPFDPPILKAYPRTKHKVYRFTRCGDMAILVSWWHRPIEPILGEGEVVGVIDGTIRKSDGGLL